MGTPEFGAIILEELSKSDFKPILVITELDKPVGRKQILSSPPVKIVAEKYNIPILQPEKLQVTSCELQELKPDLIIIAAYGQILPKEILDIPKQGCLNIHPSLLPKYRGPSPLQFTILNGAKETGVTIIKMDEKIDQGPILAKRELKIPNPKISYEKLLKELAELGANLPIETIPKWLKGEIKAIPQDESKASYTKLLKKEDGKIDWTKSAEEIERQVRAFNPWPGTFAKIQNAKSKMQNDNVKCKILKILKAEVLITPKKRKIGEIFLTDDKKLAIQTGQNCLIILKLQLEGKKPMNSRDFLNGYPNLIGAILS